MSVAGSEFPPLSLEEVHARIEAVVRGLAGTNVQVKGDTFTFSYSGLLTMVDLKVGSLTPERPSVLVVIMLMVLNHVPTTPALYETLLKRQNEQLLFGSIHALPGVGEVGIALRHGLLGDFLDDAELAVALRLLAGAALQLGPDLRTEFGGQIPAVGNF